MTMFLPIMYSVMDKKITIIGGGCVALRKAKKIKA